MRARLTGTCSLPAGVWFRPGQKDIKIGSKLINARSESILEKPSFRKAAVKRRAIIPAEGYYEWQKTDDGKKIPNYLYSEKEPLPGFAGLYEWWADPSVPEGDPGRWLLSCTVLTTTTQDALGHVHDRSPVIIPRDRFAEWLDPDLTDKNDILQLLDSLPEPTLTPRVVSPRVNSVRNNGPENQPGAMLHAQGANVNGHGACACKRTRMMPVLPRHSHAPFAWVTPPAEGWLGVGKGTRHDEPGPSPMASQRP
jgi:putative SOS response-associated peptidase YedK